MKTTPPAPPDAGANAPKPESREARLAAALRANLQRRKAQIRARATAAGSAPEENAPEETGAVTKPPQSTPKA